MINAEMMLGYLNQMRRFYAFELSKRFRNHDLSLNEISILIVLSRNPTLTTSSDLRIVLGVSKGLISRSVDRLLKKNLLSIVVDEDDKRIHHLSLTKQSLDMMLKYDDEVNRINEELLKDIDIEDLRHMEKTMLKIIECMKGVTQ